MGWTRSRRRTATLLSWPGARAMATISSSPLASSGTWRISKSPTITASSDRAPYGRRPPGSTWYASSNESRPAPPPDVTSKVSRVRIHVRPPMAHSAGTVAGLDGAIRSTGMSSAYQKSRRRSPAHRTRAARLPRVPPGRSQRRLWRRTWWAVARALLTERTGEVTTKTVSTAGIRRSQSPSGNRRPH